MITISSPCTFASFDAKTKKLTSSIITIGANTTIISGADAVSLNNDVMFFENREALIAQLKSLSVKESDGTDLVEEAVI